MSEFVALVLSLPTRNSTLRMRLWRSLKDAGCGVLRDGVYVLPANAPQVEAMSRMQAEIRGHGGFAMRLAMTPQDDAGQALLRKLFDRGELYGELVGRIAAARASLARLGSRRAQTAVARLERSLHKLSGIDFFPGEAKMQAAAALSDLKSASRALFAGGEPRFSKRRLRPASSERYRKRVWATRRAPWIDRLASAWLIKRFIDREARFVWIARPSECPKKAVGFDFDGAEFTHVKNRVTFEVLASSFGLEGDAALASIGAVVHFLDVGGIPAADAKVVEALLKGAKEKAKTDDGLLAEAMRTFDLLYSGYRSQGLPAAVAGRSGGGG